METIRINRFLAQCGLGSRRAVEALIRSGRVSVNGTVLVDLGRRVDPAEDVVEVDGERRVPTHRGTVLLLHKPVGVVSSLVRQDQRLCVLDLVPERYVGRRLFHVGRLDADSSGLLLLSDDGDLAQGLLHPSQPVWKVYRVATKPRLDPEQVSRLADGSIRLDGRAVAPARARVLGPGELLEVRLREGRNRQIRRMVEALGARVVELHRTAFGPIELGDLGEGQLREATADELAALSELGRGGR